MVSKFKVGDKVKLSDSGVEEFSKDNWCDYAVPHAIYCGQDAFIAQIEEFKNKIQLWVKYGDSLVWFYEDQLELADAGNSATEQYTGGSSDYYKIYIKNPTTLEVGYWAECNDIIEALGMDFSEGNAFKAIWRKARARQGVKKKGYDNGVYDSEKVVFFGERMLVKAKNESE